MTTPIADGRAQPVNAQSSLEVTADSGLILVQDLGRPGLAHLGVSPSGAANRAGLRAANAAVGNLAGAPALEILGSVSLAASADCVFALAGARGSVEITLPGWPSSPLPPARDWPRVVAVPAGGQISIRSGVRTYLAVQGGFDVPEVLGSASTDTLSGLGPAPITRGDRLRIGIAENPVESANSDHHLAPTTPGSLIIASVYPGPRQDWFADPDVLYSGEYRVSDLADRVGIRLAGPALERAGGFAVGTVELASEGLVRGAIQVPASGQPLVFGPDHPVTGGYPVIGVLAESSADALSHAAPGQALRFRRANLRE